MKFHEISWHEISVQDFVPSIMYMYCKGLGRVCVVISDV
jgi:hypothetical protein